MGRGQGADGRDWRAGDKGGKPPLVLTLGRGGLTGIIVVIHLYDQFAQGRRSTSMQADESGLVLQHLSSGYRSCFSLGVCICLSKLSKLSKLALNSSYFAAVVAFSCLRCSSLATFSVSDRSLLSLVLRNRAELFGIRALAHCVSGTLVGNVSEGCREVAEGFGDEVIFVAVRDFLLDDAFTCEYRCVKDAHTLCVVF